MPDRHTLFQENHIHSTFSDGTSTLEEIFEYNLLHDQFDLVITDHVNKDTDWFPKYVDEIQTLRKKYPQFTVRIGCEVKILEDGSLNTREDILNACDVVVGSVHHFPGIKTMSPEELLEKEFELTKMLAQHAAIDVLGHPFSMSMRFHKKEPPAQYVEAVYALCAQHNILFECSARYGRGTIRELVERELAQGNAGNFSFGSDAHSVDAIGNAAFTFVQPISVLVTGAGAGIGQSILKALALSKVRTRVVAADMNPLSAGLYRAAAAYTIPAAHDAAYIPELKRICTEENIEMLLIGTDTELPVLAEHAASFQKDTGTHIVVSSADAVAIADDKWKTHEFLQAHGFPHIKSALPDAVDVLNKETSFPLAIKPRIGARSIGFQIIQSEEDLQAALAESNDIVVQEYLPEDDEEYTCGALFIAGKCYGVIPMKRWLRDGDTYKAIARHDPDLEKYIEQVGLALGAEGPCCFQLRKSDGQYKMLEINCRFSGTTGAASALGFNVVNALLQHRFLQRDLYLLMWREAHIFRYWNEVIVPPESIADMQKGHTENLQGELNIM